MTHESGTLMERWLGKLAADDWHRFGIPSWVQ